MKTDSEKLKEVIEIINRYIDNEDYDEVDGDFNVYKLSGGNFDDAFYMGKSQGEGDLARWIKGVIDPEN